MAYVSLIKSRPRVRFGHRKCNLSCRLQYGKKQRSPLLIVRLSEELMQQMNLQPGDRMDILVDSDDRTGLLRRSPEGLSLSASGRSRSAVLRISNAGWLFDGTVELPYEDFKNGELLFEVPRCIQFADRCEPPVAGKPLIEVLPIDNAADLKLPLDGAGIQWRRL